MKRQATMAMPDGHNQDHNNIVLNVGNKAVVADSVTPLTTAISGQTFTMKARVVASFKITSNPSDYRCVHVAVKFLQSFFRLCTENDTIVHESPSSFSTSSSV